MKQVFRLSTLTLLALILLSTRPAAGAALDTPEQRGMRPIGDKVYVDPEMAPEQTQKLLSLVAKSRQRTALFYERLIARPSIVFCATTDCYRGFGAIGLGYTDGSTVVISPSGQRVAILAHELAHVEFSARVGGLAKVLERVPQWFDEGQAVMVSMAEEFSEDAWKAATSGGEEAPPLSSLASMSDWNRITGKHGERMQLSYGTAKREVRRWFGRAGHAGFQALLSALSNDEAFAESYARIETLEGHAVATGGGQPEPAGYFVLKLDNPAPDFARATW